MPDTQERFCQLREPLEVNLPCIIQKRPELKPWPLSCLSIWNLKMIEQGFILVLSSEAGVCQETIYMPPFMQATIVEKFEFISNYERDVMMGKAFLEHQ